jgi:hypothetical protein
MFRNILPLLLCLLSFGSLSCIEETGSSQRIPEFRVLCESSECTQREYNGVHKAYGFLTTTNCTNPFAGLILESETEVFCNSRGCTGFFEEWFDGDERKNSLKVSSLQACFSIDFKGQNKSIRSYSTEGNLRSKLINLKINESGDVVYIYEWTEV